MDTYLIDAFKKLFNLLDKGQDTRNEIINAVNDLSSAILNASIYTSTRFNRAFLTKNKDEKLDILVNLHNDEIEAHAKVNGLCGTIAQASNEIEHFLSDLNRNRNLDSNSTDGLKEIITILQRGEGGLQTIMSDYISLPVDLEDKDGNEINEWLKEKLKSLADLSQAALSCQSKISQVI